MTQESSANSNSRLGQRFARQWNHRPTVPIATSPLFQWPLQPADSGRWFAARWLIFGENLFIAGLAILTWYFLQPSLEVTSTLEFDWIALMYLRNLALIAIVAGGLHYTLHTRKSQGKRLKFDPDELTAKGRRFTFNTQFRDNLFWTLSSGVFFWTSFEVLMLWAISNGYAPLLLWTKSPVWFVALLLLTPLWISFHFYWVHRFLHWPTLYRSVHALHHRNTNIGPWSGLSMHPVEHVLFFSSVLIHWILAAHPIHILFHMQHQALTAATSHAGFESLLHKDKKALSLGNFHHQMHHRYFECNYGSLEIPWDKFFGSFHDGTEHSHEQFIQRRRKMAKEA